MGPAGYGAGSPPEGLSSHPKNALSSGEKGGPFAAEGGREDVLRTLPGPREKRRQGLRVCGEPPPGASRRRWGKTPLARGPPSPFAGIPFPDPSPGAEGSGEVRMTPDEREGDTPQAKAPEPSEAPAPESEDWKTRYQYLLAEFDNYRKRTQRELKAAAYGARADLLLRVISLHDGIERARDHLPAEAGELRQGLDRVLENFRSLLEEEQLRPVARVGEPFRPEDHEAVGSVHPTPEAPAGTVAAVVQEGYRSPNGLLRPAKVLVSAPPPAGPTASGEGAGGEEAKVQAPEPSPPEGEAQ